MDKILIGCGGWSFFKAKGDPLINYSRVFDFVEINSTFYKIPDDKTCQNWKKKVKNNPNFLFSIKVFQEITHKYKLRPININFKLFNEMKRVCKILNSNLLVFQTPVSVEPNKITFKEIDDFFSAIHTKDLFFIWEPRNISWYDEKNYKYFENIITKYDIIHCIDLFKSSPKFINSKLAYSRIFGPTYDNMYQFDDNEIIQLNNKFLQISNQTENVIISFHTQRMIHDAARAQEYYKNGKLIGVSGKYGIESFMDVIKEYENYPITKNELIIKHGWKIYDKTENLRERMELILNKIEDKIYKNRNDLKNEIYRHFT
ncbi:MAG: DUF72 domain-containing protein [Candidatus Helarchaeota archaeon]